MTIIKNVNPSPHYNCNCGTWLKHWQKFSPVKTTGCAAANCQTPATLGAHVQLSNSYDEAMYVIPLCEEHGSVTVKLEIAGSYKLVPADRALTCERW